MDDSGRGIINANNSRKSELYPYFQFLGVDPGVGPESLHTGKRKIKENRPQKGLNVSGTIQF